MPGNPSQVMPAFSAASPSYSTSPIWYLRSPIYTPTGPVFTPTSPVFTPTSSSCTRSSNSLPLTPIESLKKTCNTPDVVAGDQSSPETSNSEKFLSIEKRRIQNRVNQRRRRERLRIAAMAALECKRFLCNLTSAKEMN